MSDKKKKEKIAEKTVGNDETLEPQEVVDKTVITSIERLDTICEKEAYILFMSGPLQGKLHCLAKSTTVIGRDESVDIQIKDVRISRRHFQIDREGGFCILKDLGSTNGTYVNGSRAKVHALEDGDRIQIPGSVVIKFAHGDTGERMFLDEFYHMANFDAVTGATSKHAFTKRLDEEFSYANRTNNPLSLLMIDIDFFKKVNDTHGHLAGDLALSHIATSIMKTIRNEDIAARYGGEEFAVILRGIDSVGAAQLGERVRKGIEGFPMKFEDKMISLTVSVGVATLKEKNYKTPTELIDAADKCLYEAKETGRNKVVSKC